MRDLRVEAVQQLVATLDIDQRVKSKKMILKAQQNIKSVDTLVTFLAQLSFAVPHSSQAKKSNMR
jgi:hypothetical protein